MADITLKDLHEELKTTFESFKERHDQYEAELKQFGDARGQTKETLDKIENKMQEIEGQIKDVQTKISRHDPAKGGGDQSTPETEYKDAFFNWCRKGTVPVAQKAILDKGIETKGLTAQDDTGGGYLAPSEFVNEIIKGITEFSPIRTVARIKTTSNRSVRIPKRTGTFSASWVAETGSRSEATGWAFGMEDVPAHELFAKVVISQQELEDSAFNLEAELRMESTEQFAVAEGTAFVSGNAVGKPEGLLTNSNVGATNSGDANLLKADGLIDLFYAVKDGYARNGTFLFRRASIGAIRKLKGSDNNYLWQPGLAADKPPTLLGQPYVECVDVPAVAANAYPILFGDFRRGYLIVDRIGISIQRDPFSDADNGNVVFRVRKRVGGQVINPEAVRKQKVSA